MSPKNSGQSARRDEKDRDKDSNTHQYTEGKPTYTEVSTLPCLKLIR
jgi:hypothetical protein